MSCFETVGTPAPRHDAWAKAEGEQLYSDDFALPGMLYGKALRSKYPAAVIRSVDTGKAKAVPGVHAVLTAQDVPRNIDVTKFGQMKDVGGGFEGLYKVLADGKVRFKGEAVALVAAETEELAEEACRLIEVDYEVQPGVFDPEEALKPGAYLVSSEDNSNQIMKCHIEKGDVDQAFAEADLIIENEYRTSAVDHTYLETEGGVAWIDENGVITMRVGTQVLEHYRTVAKIMGFPHNKVRNMSIPMGGGFGGKEDITVEAFLALLTWKTKRPVKMVWSREESIESHSKRHPEILRYKSGFTKAGILLAQQVDIVLDGGGYTYLTPWVQMYSNINAPGCYRVPHIKIDSVSALTNNTFTSANRGFGANQVNFATELQMDEAAARLGISPLEIRRKNCLKNGDELCTGFIPQGHIALEEIAQKAWKVLEDAGPKPDDMDGRKIGRGLAIGMMSYGRLCFLHDSSRVGLRIELDGSVTLRAGVPDLGGGQASVLCQIVAEELGLPMDKIHPYIMDTHLTPLCGTTTATRQLYMSGNAALVTVHVLKERILKKAGELLKVQPEEVQLIHERACLINDPSRGLPFGGVVAALSNEGISLFHEGQFNAPFSEVPNLMDIKGRILPDMTYTAHGAEVAVDEETGRFEVLRIVACADVGKAINRHSCEGQMEGGAIYNMGYVTENMIQEKGYTRSHSLSEYLIPTAADTPEIETIMVESGGGLGPYGAKGIGEPADNSIAPAIVNAIYDAVGVRVKSLPVTPEILLFAIKNKA
ncbi:xanthine dehydrogenase family protein molybdopterin-binding subunit [Candidatus Formimonas warabiya]|nr:xanthine dehydrogenase family protein molybdopterin-binding subunit [Candidatus Formimonas warabiya]